MTITTNSNILNSTAQSMSLDKSLAFLKNNDIYPDSSIKKNFKSIKSIVQKILDLDPNSPPGNFEQRLENGNGILKKIISAKDDKRIKKFMIIVEEAESRNTCPISYAIENDLQESIPFLNKNGIEISNFDCFARYFFLLLPTNEEKIKLLHLICSPLVQKGFKHLSNSAVTSEVTNKLNLIFYLLIHKWNDIIPFKTRYYRNYRLRFSYEVLKFMLNYGLQVNPSENATVTRLIKIEVFSANPLNLFVCFKISKILCRIPGALPSCKKILSLLFLHDFNPNFDVRIFYLFTYENKTPLTLFDILKQKNERTPSEELNQFLDFLDLHGAKTWEGLQANN
ncbi:MAG: hypothetical protein K1000chlam3_00854 [Chlamydiae bacterium]|nr:hypothetical protein [Chlamydiota bacterium]